MGEISFSGGNIYPISPDGYQSNYNYSPNVNYNLGPGRAEEILTDLVDICLNKIIKITSYIDKFFLALRAANAKTSK